MRLVPLLVLLALAAGLAAGDAPAVTPAATDPAAGAAAAGPDLAAVGALFERVAGATTSAQVYAFKQRAMEAVKGKPITATFVVADVKAVTLDGQAKYQVEGAHEDPAFGLLFYTADEEGALALDAGDTVTLAGTGHGLFFDREKALAVDGCTIVTVVPRDGATP